MKLASSVIGPRYLSWSGLSASASNKTFITRTRRALAFAAIAICIAKYTDANSDGPIQAVSGPAGLDGRWRKSRNRTVES